MNEVEIIGTGSYVPDNIVSNEYLSQLVDTSDEWVYSRTGIKNRRITGGEKTWELSVKAALAALENAKVSPEEVDLIITATVSPDKFCPSNACIVQKEIGAINAFCFDINAACTGFLYSMNIAAQFIKTGQAKTALIIGVEMLSKLTDWTDRSTCVLFGDGAGAAVLRSSKEKKLKSIFTASDGSRGEYLNIEAINLRNPFVNEKQDEHYIYMNGKEVFKFAVKVMEESIYKVLTEADMELNDIKYILPHQANIRIVEYVANKLKLPMDKFFMNIQDYGNTSAASIPIALDEMNQKGLLNKGDKIIIVGFGGGLTWGASLLEW